MAPIFRVEVQRARALISSDGKEVSAAYCELAYSNQPKTRTTLVATVGKYISWEQTFVFDDDDVNECRLKVYDLHNRFVGGVYVDIDEAADTTTKHVLTNKAGDVSGSIKVRIYFADDDNKADIASASLATKPFPQPPPNSGYSHVVPNSLDTRPSSGNVPAVKPPPPAGPPPPDNVATGRKKHRKSDRQYDYDYRKDREADLAGSSMSTGSADLDAATKQNLRTEAVHKVKGLIKRAEGTSTRRTSKSKMSYKTPMSDFGSAERYRTPAFANGTAYGNRYDSFVRLPPRHYAGPPSQTLQEPSLEDDERGELVDWDYSAKRPAHPDVSVRSTALTNKVHFNRKKNHEFSSSG